MNDERDKIYEDFTSDVNYNNASRAKQSLDRKRKRDYVFPDRVPCERHEFSTTGRCFACGYHRE